MGVRGKNKYRQKGLWTQTSICMTRGWESERVVEKKKIGETEKGKKVEIFR